MIFAGQTCIFENKKSQECLKKWQMYTIIKAILFNIILMPWLRIHIRYRFIKIKRYE